MNVDPEIRHDDGTKLRELGARISRAEADLKTDRGTAVDVGRAVGGFGMMRVGADFAAIVLGSTGAGWLLDLGLGTAPWGMLVFLLLGFCSGVLTIWRVLQKSDAADQEEEKERNDGDALSH